MEMELEPKVKPLPYKIKGMSRESPTQKALHVLDTDLRTHWSTGTNTKEWILLELDEPCLLSQIRIYNKSVLEWEIAVGLRYKPEAFVKVRPRCEAPRRDMMYPMNYTPCRYVRISCLRGNPIAIFFIELVGVSVIGLEPEFQPVVNHLLPQIVAHKQDAENMHLQLLQDITNRLLVFLPQLEADLTSYSEAAESNTRFLAMLAGPLYPILHIVNEREVARAASFPDSETSRNTQATTLTVSSNFEAQPRRSRSPSPFVPPASSSIVFRPDTVFMLLRKAYKDSHLGIVCRMAARVLQKLIDPGASPEVPNACNTMTSSISDETAKAEASNHHLLADYSSLFGEEFRTPDDQWDSSYLNILDIGAVEEGILHVLFACASQPILCRKLAENGSEFWSVLPLIQALLPALRPPVGSSRNNIDDSFSQWKQPFVQQALSQIVATSSSQVYCPLLHASAGYLSSFSPSHAKAACVLIDMCSGPLAPWTSTVIAKVDLTIELLEELLGTIQGVQHSITRARAALKYIILALSGHMDDVLAKYKEVKHKVLFLVEMLEPFLDPAITVLKNTIAFGDVSSNFPKKQERACALALNVICTAVRKPAVLPSLESEWRRGSVAPSVLLSILGPHMQLPPEIDLCKSPVSGASDQDTSALLSTSSILRQGGFFSKSNSLEESDGKSEVFEASAKVDAFEDASLLFAPPELKSTALRNLSNFFEGQSSDNNYTESSRVDVGTEGKYQFEKDLNNLFKKGLTIDVGFAAEYFNLQADFLQLMNHRDCELRSSEYRRLALELHSQHDGTPEGHDAAIDALLLAAECYLNPFFMMAFTSKPKIINRMNIGRSRSPDDYDLVKLKNVCENKHNNLEMISFLERKRDITVLQILLEAAELDREYHRRVSDGDCLYETGETEQVINISPDDKNTTDAVTLVRQNQALLCKFLVHRLQRDQHSMHEILMQSLLFLLHSGTEISCSPEDVIDMILGSAEYLNGLLSSFYHQLKGGNLQVDPEKVYGVQRRWVILQKLVIASSTGDEGSDFTINTHDGFRFRSLIPPSSWMQKILKFSTSSCPLVRFLGWMAISRYAKQYLKEQIFLASDLTELTSLLSIFADELARVDDIVKDEAEKLRLPETCGLKVNKGSELLDQSHGDRYFHVIYPELYKFFPNMKKQFEGFGEVILEAVGLQLRSIPSSAIPDVLCWFSDLCLWPFVETGKDPNYTGLVSDNLKGYAAKNAKAIILYMLEAIIIEHMEAMVPEIPRVVQVLLSLCRASYCDVTFLDSILSLLKPLISYALRKISAHEKLLADDSSCLNFESLCFDELFSNVKYRVEYQDSTAERLYSGALTIFILGFLFPNLSFVRKSELLESLVSWADFTTFEPTSCFYDYLCAFQKIMESCGFVLVQTLQDFGIPVSVDKHRLSAAGSVQVIDDDSEEFSCFLDDALDNPRPVEVSNQSVGTDDDTDVPNHNSHALSTEEIEEFCTILECLVNKLNPTIDRCWKLHHKLTKKLALTSTKCYMYSRCLLSIVPKELTSADNGVEDVFPSVSDDHNSPHWRTGLEAIAGAVMTLQQNHCWEVASVMLDYLLGLPQFFCLDDVVGTICSSIKHFCCHAPRISWRLQTDKWLSILFRRGIGSFKGEALAFVDLFQTMLGHPEPEQRSVALQHLSQVVGLDANGDIAKLPNAFIDNLSVSNSFISLPESVLSLLVSSTWDKVVLLASSDRSVLLRIRAMTLLMNYIPFAEHGQLQSFLGAADRVLHGFGKLSFSVCESPLIRLSIALLACACLYCSLEDVTLIPPSVWRNLETLGMSNSGEKLGDMEKKACQALCKMREEADDAKVVLKEVLSSGPTSKQDAPDFSSTRETILQVLANLTSVQTYFDMFSERVDKRAMELDEAEIELDLLQEERALQEISGDNSKDTLKLPFVSYEVEDDNRLQEIKDGIRSLEKARLREEIAARRQKKLLVRHARQKYLEEAALREAELLQDLDRERTSEVEREIERQRLLELERVKTRELRYNLEMEKERQTQRELQRELEQAESGVRPSRREFSSSTTSRSRDRYRERENGRSGQEGSLRPSSSGRETMQSSTSAGAGLTVPTVVLGGSRQFSGQLPTILSSRDRSHERGSSYEDFDGSKDSGDTGSVGDPDLASAFDGQPGGFGSAQRHGSRGSKSRQIMERREREGRREGKWERKH